MKRWIVAEVMGASLGEYARECNRMLDGLSAQGYVVEHVEPMATMRVETKERGIEVMRDRHYTVVRASREEAATGRRIGSDDEPGRRERVLEAIRIHDRVAAP